MSALNSLLVADLQDILGGIGACVFVIIWFISTLAGIRQKAPRDRPPGMPVGEPQDQGVLETEIDKFLKQAKSKRTGGDDDVEIFEPAEEPLRQPPMAEPLEAELVREPPIGELRNRHAVSAQVAADLDTSRTERRIERMGDNVEAADEVMASHVRDVFDHPLGSLTDTSLRGYSQAETAAEPESEKITSTPTAAVDFAALLGNVDNIRQAIVMNEILQRPVDRW